MKHNRKLFFLIAIIALFGTAYAAQDMCLENEIYFKENQIDTINFRDKDGNNALHLALMAGENSFAEEIFLQDPWPGGIVDTENSYHKSPISVADLHNNTEGVKLTLDYYPKSGSADNNCFQIFEKVKGTPPHQTNQDLSEFYYPENEENSDKLAIILNASGNGTHFFSYFKKNKVPTLIINKGYRSLTQELIKKTIEDTIKKTGLPEKIIVFVTEHGSIDEEGDHQIHINSTHHELKIKNFFITLKSIFKDKAININLGSCYGGGAIKDVDLLPKGSKLLALSQADKTVNEEDSRRSLLKGEYTSFNPSNPETYPSEDYQKNPEKFSLEYFMLSYLLTLTERNNIPEMAISGGEKIFDHRDLTQYIGHKLTDEQKNTILNQISPYTDNCENDILKAIQNVENVNSIDDLKAPEFIDRTYREKYNTADHYLDRIFSHPTKIPCYIPHNRQYLKKHLEKTSNDLNTDFSRCKMMIMEDDIQELCDIYKPEKPLFGTALAFLYMIKKLGF